MVSNRDLEKRLEELSTNFLTKMTAFQAELDDRKCNQVVDSSDQIAERFDHFRVSIVKEIESLKTELNKFKDEYHSENNRKSLLLHGVSEDLGDIYGSVTEVFHINMNLDIKKEDLDYCFRLGGARDSTSGKPRPIIVYFRSRWQRDVVYHNKKKLKGSSVLITEVLTSERLKLFKEIRGVMKKDCWTLNGKIFILHNNKKQIIQNLSEFRALAKVGK